MDSDTGTVYRTPNLPNELNFDYKVVTEPFNIQKLKDLCSKNMDKLHLNNPKTVDKSFPKPRCSVSVNPPSTSLDISNNSTIQVPKTSPSKRCHVCKHTIKGRRGLYIHLGRSPECKRNYQQPPSVPPDLNNLTLSSKIANTVKCPSTTL